MGDIVGDLLRRYMRLHVVGGLGTLSSMCTHTCRSMLRYIFIILVIGTPLLAQEVRFRRIGVEQGLPQSYVNQLSEDAQGFLWIGTQDGVARFDGRRMDVYRRVPGDSTSIAGNNVFDLLLAQDGRLYAHTGDGRCWFDPARNVWHRYATSPPPARHAPGRVQVHDGSVNITYTDRRGRLWVATARDGLYVTDPASSTTYRFTTSAEPQQRLPVNDVWALCEDSRGRMWVGLNGGGLVIVDTMRIVARYRHIPSEQTSLSSDVVRVLYEDAIGTMWIGTHGGGLCQFDPYAHVVPLLRPTLRNIGRTDDFVRAIASRDGRTLMVGLRTGIMQTDASLSSASMVVQWDDEVDRVGAARALAYAPDGSLWIGTERRGVGVLRRGSRSVQWLPSADPKRIMRQTVSFVGVADSAHMLVGTDDGIARISISTLQQQWFDVPQSPDPTNLHMAVSSMVRRDRDEYLVGTEHGLFRGPLGATATKIDCPDQLVIRPNIDVIRTIEIVDDVAYVATWGAGIRRIDLRSGKERVIDSRIGFPNNTVYAAYPLSSGRILASTNAGIVIWNDNAQRVERILTPAHGAQEYEFNSWSHASLGNGRYALGGIRGLNVVNVTNLAVLPPPRTVIVTDTLAHGDVRVYVRPIALSVVEPITYRIKLHATDTSWTATPTVDLLLSSLSSGTYHLHVQARYASGEYGPVAELQFVVPTPAWRSWWAIAGTFIMLTAGVWSAATSVARRREARRLEQERVLNQERVRIARDLHDDVGTGLAKIVIMAENSTLEQDQKSIRAIADTAQEVIDSVRSIVWVMKSSDDRLATTIGYVQAKVSDLMYDKGIAFTYEEILSRDRSIDTITMRNIVLATKEIATNIVRHSRATNVAMYVRDQQDVLTVDIRDNGSGFEVGKQRTGNGLHNIHERMTESGGSVAIESSPGEGTRIVLTIPLQSRQSAV